ncbi:hypothetical protein PANDA_006615 [Ailuropoda melanoleuca]|uniref:5-hydroxytryptamine receptor 4 n=1 Tax=Ailuropoda melanoleuca TaxID=9646 RepID=D2H8N8_AILME|nr:hypothetical protein PANDA_006615 [Ailuropoda melanoleuca]
MNFGEWTALWPDEDCWSRFTEWLGAVKAVILTAILGNLLVMAAVCRDRQLRKIKTNYFIVSLAFVDLLVSVLVMPFGAIELVQDIWIYGEMFCLVRTSLDVLLTTASIFHLCCISLDRSYHESVGTTDLG